MLSILIPCFDYNAYPLVCEIDKQALILELKFEIICIDVKIITIKIEIPTNNTKKISIEHSFLLK